MGPSLLPSVKETSEFQIDMMDVANPMPLLPKEEDEFLPRHSGYKRRAMDWYTPPVSEAKLDELGRVQKSPRRGYKRKNRPKTWTWRGRDGALADRYKQEHQRFCSLSELTLWKPDHYQ
eukprot:g44769.t1